MAGKKEEDKKSIVYIRVKSLEDLCRYAYNFDFTSDNLLKEKTGKGYRISILGESIGDSVIAYYIETGSDNSGTMIKYNVPSNGASEEIKFLTKVESTDIPRINLISIDLKAFKGKGIKRKSITSVKLGSLEDITKFALKKAAKYESSAHLYSFEYKKSIIICGFDLIDKLEDSKQIFYYIQLGLERKNRGRFIKYNYSENTIDFTDSIGEHPYAYIKIINLADSFPFFKL